MLGPVMMDLAGVTLDAAEAEQLRHPLVGGVILFTRNFESVAQLTDLVKEIRAVRSEILIAADTEGGRVQRFRDGFFRLPPARAYGAVYDADPEWGREASRLGGWILAAELRAMDVDLAFSPVVDVDDGVSSVIGDRSFHGDVDALIELSRAHCEGLSEAGMAPTAKHFPGHGAVGPDSHLELPVDERPLEALLERDVRPYTALIADGLPSIMVAHVQYPAVDERPASLSPLWVDGILRRQLGFRGAIFTDDLSMGGVAGMGDVLERARLAEAAGCDMLPICNRPADVARLLDSWSSAADPTRSARLVQLRGQGGGQGMAELQRRAEYDRRVSRLNELMEAVGHAGSC